MNINTQTFNDLKDRLLHYVMTLSTYEQYAWMAVILGFIMILIALILW